MEYFASIPEGDDELLLAGVEEEERCARVSSFKSPVFVLSMIDIPIVMKKLGRRVNLSFIFVHSFVIDVLFCM